MSENPPAPNAFEQAWKKVIDNWESDEAHNQLISFCQATETLAEAGKHYRAIRDLDDERAPIAARQIKRIVVLAMQNLELQRTTPDHYAPYQRWLLLLSILIAGALVSAAIWAWTHMG